VRRKDAPPHGPYAVQWTLPLLEHADNIGYNLVQRPDETMIEIYSVAISGFIWMVFLMTHAGRNDWRAEVASSGRQFESTPANHVWWLSRVGLDD
jgi:hypothetical protein